MEQVKEEQLEKFQQEVLLSVELLWTAAQNQKGRGFTPQQINHIAGYLNSLSVALMQHEKAKLAYDVMLDAYVAQHGREIFDKISGGEQVVDAVVEGVVVNDEEQVSESEGPNAQGEGLDSPNKGEESGTLLEETSNAYQDEEG